MTDQTILVVEDDADIRTLLQFMLEREGYHPLLAEDGQQAIDLIEQESADIVLLDVMLPYFDGFQILERMRETTKWKDVPVIMLTAKSQEKDVVHALNLGANDYINKPFTPMELMARIKRYLIAA